MKRTRLLLLLALTASLTSGCVITVNTDDEYDDNDWRSRQVRNERAINRMELGRSQSSIVSELGEPDFVDAFSRDGQSFKVLYFRTHRVTDDGATTRNETTPLVFVDGVLVGWGETAIHHATAR